MANQPQGFPQITAPIANQSGYVSQPWYNFFIALWNRTGGGQGGATVPTGGMLPFAAGAANLPGGFLLCDGSAVSRGTFPGLFSIIGTTWGAGDGSTTFNVPDLRNRFVYGQGANATGATGGANQITLDVSQLPAHSHTVSDPGHVHIATVSANTNTAGSGAGSVTVGDTQSALTGISIDNTGSGSPIDIRPAYAVATWIIKT
jgi:microcystin-dependent protein